MRAWYFDLKEFKPEPGFESEFIVEHEGVKYHHLCKVTKAIPPRKLAYTWRYKGEPGDSLVTFELFPDGNKTQLRLTHEGLETFPKSPAYARKNFEMGWTSIATELQPSWRAGSAIRDLANNDHLAEKGKIMTMQAAV